MQVPIAYHLLNKFADIKTRQKGGVMENSYSATNKNIFELVDDEFIKLCDACKRYEDNVSHVNLVNNKLNERIDVYKGINTFYECPPVVSAMRAFDSGVRALHHSKMELDAQFKQYQNILNIARLATA